MYLPHYPPLSYPQTCPASHKLYGGGASRVPALATLPPGAGAATEVDALADLAALIHPAALAIILGKY